MLHVLQSRIELIAEFGKLSIEIRLLCGLILKTHTFMVSQQSENTAYFLREAPKSAILRLKMAILTIVTGKDSAILRAKTKEVQTITKEIKTLVQSMKETTVASNGAGIAAPQVNRTERVCIAMLQKKLTPLINPHILWRSTDTETMEEGCLSLPDLWIQVTRPREIVVKFLSLAGKERELKLSDFDARVVQHEVDHLEGILIVDHMKVGKVG